MNSWEIPAFSSEFRMESIFLYPMVWEHWAGLSPPPSPSPIPLAATPSHPSEPVWRGVQVLKGGAEDCDPSPYGLRGVGRRRCQGDGRGGRGSEDRSRPRSKLDRDAPEEKAV